MSERNNPAYYQNGKFYYLDGRIEEAAGSIKIGGTEISKASMWKIASSCALPHSMLASLFSGKKYIGNLEGLSVVFFDVETDDNEQFLFAYAKSGGEMKRFASVEALADFLLVHDVIVGFNSFRFDYEVIFRKDSRFHEVDCSGFKIKIVPNKVNIDAFFYFCCWRPWKDSHSLNSLAEEMRMTRSWDLDNKEEKCKEDIEIMAAFYGDLRQIYAFLAWFGMDYLSYSSIPAKWMSKLRRWMLQGWALKNGMLPALVKRETTEKAGFFRYCKRGFYRGVHSFDVSSAYPSTAARLSTGLWKEHDFAEYMEWLIKKRREAGTEKDFVKYISVATIGDMGSNSSLLFDKKIFCDTWNIFRGKMERWVKKVGKKNIIYSYTDSIVTAKADVGGIDGYEVRWKDGFEWFCVYNIERILALRKDGSVLRNHFNKGMAQLGMWKDLEKRIDIELRRDPGSFLADPLQMVAALEKMDDSCFKIVIRKTEEQCRNLDYYMIWDELKMGFNEVYLGKKGIVLDSKQKSMKKYEKLAKSYLKLYKFRVKENGKGRGKS